MLVEIEGGNGLRTVDSPIRLAGVHKIPPTPAPAVGQHTREVLGSLGYDDARIEALLASGVAHAAPADGG
jgi:formyl-CoA transferase